MVKLTTQRMIVGATVFVVLVLAIGVWMTTRTTKASVTNNKPSLISQRFPTPQAVDSIAYRSIQERRLPCGRILRRTVEARDGAWAKTVTLMTPEGRILKSNTRTIEPETCALIQKGRFVPNLWSDCSVSLD